MKSKRERVLEKDNVFKYWFVSYHFNTEKGFGFGNCWVSGGDFLEVPTVEKWVKDREGFRCAKVLYFQEITRDQYIHGLANMEVAKAEGRTK